MSLHAHCSHPLYHYVRLSTYTARRARDQSVLVQTRKSTVDPVAQHLLQPFNQVSHSDRPPFFLLRRRRFRRYLALSSVTPRRTDRVPKHLSTFASRISRRHESHCISSSKRSLILGPPVVAKDLPFLLSEKRLIDLRLDNWPEKLRNDA